MLILISKEKQNNQKITKSKNKSCSLKKNKIIKKLLNQRIKVAVQNCVFQLT